MAPIIVGGSVVVAVWWALRMCPDAFIVTVFCRIPAELAAWYYNASLQVPELAFTVRGSVFEVIRPCGATDFFSMVAGLMVYTTYRTYMTHRTDGTEKGLSYSSYRSYRSYFLLLSLSILPLAWGITVFANTLRVIFLVPAKLWLYHHHIPNRAYIDTCLGMLVFLALFMILWKGVHYVTRNTATR